MGMNQDTMCYAHYWHPFADAMLPICDVCVAFFDETSVDVAGEPVAMTTPCHQCGEDVVHPLMYWLMYRGGSWLCEACIAAETEDSSVGWTPPHLPVSSQLDERSVYRNFTYEGARLRVFEQHNTGTVAFVIEDLCRALGIPSVGDARAWLYDEMLEIVVEENSQELLLLVTEPGLYQLLMAYYRQARSDEVMRFVHWLWWKMPVGKGKP